MIWMGIAFLALVGVGVMVGLNVNSFIADGSASSKDTIQLTMYSLIRNTDWPMISLLIGSLLNVALCWIFWRSPAKNSNSDVDSEQSDAKPMLEIQ